MRSSCYLRSGTKKSHGCRTTPLRLSCVGRAEIVRCLCDPRELLKFRLSNVYNYLFLIEIALQTCKTNYIIRQRHQLTQKCQIVWRPHDHRGVAVRLPHDDCSISVQFYGHCTGIVRRLCDSRAGALRSSQEPTAIVRLFCSKMTSKNLAFFARWPCDHRAMPVRGSCDAPTTCLRATFLRF